MLQTYLAGSIEIENIGQIIMTKNIVRTFQKLEKISNLPFLFKSALL